MTERGKSIQEECEDWATRMASQGTLLRGRADLKLRGFGDTDWELANWLLRIKPLFPEETSPSSQFIGELGKTGVRLKGD